MPQQVKENAYLTKILPGQRASTGSRIEQLAPCLTGAHMLCLLLLKVRFDDVEASKYVNTHFSPRHREMIYLLFIILFSNSSPPSKPLLIRNQLLIKIELEAQTYLKKIVSY